MKAVQHCGAKQQAGMVLVVALIILLVLSIIVIGSAGDSTLQQHMASNYDARQIAFQAAESGLRDGEAKAVSLAGDPNIFLQGKTAGLYGPDASIDPLSATQWDSAHSIAGTPTVLPNGVRVTPRYVVQMMRNPNPGPVQIEGYGLSATLTQTTTLFAITARAVTPRGGRTVLRSYYRAGHTPGS